MHKVFLFYDIFVNLQLLEMPGRAGHDGEDRRVKGAEKKCARALRKPEVERFFRRLFRLGKTFPSGVKALLRE